MNENEFYGYDPISFFEKYKDKSVLMANSSHLYEQIDGKFTNITEKAGLLSPTFGLGLCISEIIKMEPLLIKFKHQQSKFLSTEWV